MAASSSFRFQTSKTCCSQKLSEAGVTSFMYNVGGTWQCSSVHRLKIFIGYHFLFYFVLVFLKFWMRNRALNSYTEMKR